MQIISVEILIPRSLKLLRELEELQLIRLITGSVNKAEKPKKESGFFLSAGIWKDRDISGEDLRNKAWKRK
jgi:hypothetical protein